VLSPFGNTMLLQQVSLVGYTPLDTTLVAEPSNIISQSFSGMANVVWAVQCTRVDTIKRPRTGESCCFSWYLTDSYTKWLHPNLSTVLQIGAVVQWVQCWLVISRSQVQILLEATLRNNLWQVVYTCVPLSPSSITWYRPKGLGR